MCSPTEFLLEVRNQSVVVAVVVLIAAVILVATVLVATAVVVFEVVVAVDLSANVIDLS